MQHTQLKNRGDFSLAPFRSSDNLRAIWQLLTTLLDSDAHANLIVWAPGVDRAATAVASEDQLLTVVHSDAAEDVVRAAAVALDLG